MSSLDQDINEGLLIVLGAAGLAFLFFSLFIALPLIAAGFGGWAFYQWKFKSPAALERKAKEHTQMLYEAAVARGRDLPDDDAFLDGVLETLPADLPDDLRWAVLMATKSLYDAELFHVDIPPPPAVCNSLEGARYRDSLSEQSAKLSNPAAARLAAHTVRDSFAAFSEHLPAIASDDASPFSMPLVDYLGDDASEAIEALVIPFFADNVEQLGLFKHLREQVTRNLHEVSDIAYIPKNYGHPDLILPSQYAGESVALDYLKGTPFLDIFNARVPVRFDPKTRFEHHWILAGTGHGKTQALQYLLAYDLEKVADGEASVVVIDSQNKLIDTITHLDLFSTGMPLDDKLVWIDPGDVEYPLCLNLFNVHLERLNNYSMRDRERLLNNLVELYDFVLRSLIDAPLTSRQSTLFQFLTRLMLHIPDSNIHTFLDLLKPKSFEAFEPYIAQLDRTARDFFETDFRDGKYNDTMAQVCGRLFSILKSQTFDRMFSHRENRIDLFEELKTPKVVLINTDKDLLKEGGSGFFGRFFIAMLRQAAEERTQVAEPIPTYLYFDEAADYFDEQFPILLSQVRKHNIGCVIANQFMEQADAKTVSALFSNTSIKFVGGVSPRDARRLAPALNTTPAFIRDQPKMTFAAHIKGATQSAFSLKIPMLHMEKMERMSDEEYAALRNEMRRRYARAHTAGTDELADEDSSGAPSSDEEPPRAPATGVAEESPEEERKRNAPPSTPGTTTDPDNPDITPSDTW